MRTFKVIDFSGYSQDKFDEYIEEMYNCTCKTDSDVLGNCMNCPSSSKDFTRPGNICNCRTLLNCYLRRFVDRSFASDCSAADIRTKQVGDLSDEIDKRIMSKLVNTEIIKDIMNP